MGSMASPGATLSHIGQELNQITVQTTKISTELIAAVKADTEARLGFGSNIIEVTTLGLTDEAMKDRMMGDKWRERGSATGWNVESPIILVRISGSWETIYFHPTSGGRLRPQD